MEIIQKYFGNLSAKQKFQFAKLQELYSFWNNKINVISRKDIENVYLHHVLHSLSIAKIISFAVGSRIIDVGTGGGFPGIPLAILFPWVDFLLIDSIGKKINVVNSIIKESGLTNALSLQINSRDLRKKFDFVISRAVSPLPVFYDNTRHLVSNVQKNDLKNGIIYLKGGNIDKEINDLKKGNKNLKLNVHEINDHFSETFFESKVIIYIQVS